MITDEQQAGGPVPPKQTMIGTQPGAGVETPIAQTPGMLTDAQYIELFNKYKRESFDQRWIFERQWLRNIYYVLNRMWIYWDSKRGSWQDKRLAKWIPRPCNPKAKDIEGVIHAMFSSIELGANARPQGNDPKSVIAAGVADQYIPVLHDEHDMDQVFSEQDFWMIVTGNAFIHTCLDRDVKYGAITDLHVDCQGCGASGIPESAIADSNQTCPECQAPGPFNPTLGPDGEQSSTQHAKTKGITVPLSPLEVAFPLTYQRWDDLPYIIRLRWREKVYYEQHEDLKAYIPKIEWAKSPASRTMQVFKSLPLQNDLGNSPAYNTSGGGGSAESEGVAEYDIWIKPNDDFPEGHVIRIAGDANPVVIHCEAENLPGPLPYHTSDGKPMWTFSHSCYTHVGGRILGSGALDPVIQKIDTLNQLDSLILMIIMRMANPVWLEPKGAEVEKFTGEPGLVVKWNPLAAGGNAKPERIPGENVPPSLFTYRELLMADIDGSTGLSDPIKGVPPSGVDAFAALQLLVERGQVRFAQAMKSRGGMYRDWAKFALEIEREFGPETRHTEMASPNKGWVFNTLSSADLEGSVKMVVEDGSNKPKTSLGIRAAIQQAIGMKVLDPTDPDTEYSILEHLGITDLKPTLDSQVNAALVNQENFEEWAGDPQAVMGTPPPLVWKRWFDGRIHRQEFVKWANSDKMRALFTKMPAIETLADAYLQQIDLVLAQTAMGLIDVGGTLVPNDPQKRQGGAQPAAQPGLQAGAQGPANSDRNAAGVGPTSSGAGGTAQPQA